MSQKTKSFYHSMAWKKTRGAYLKSVGCLCERCFDKGIITPAEIVHHRVPLTDENVSDTNISLSWNNLQALCRKCHAEVHDDIYAARSGKRYRIDQSGRVVIRDDTVL